jgi:hypothetical protein
MRTRLIPALAVLLLVVALSACGGSNGSAFEGSSTTGASSTSQASTTTTSYAGGESSFAAMVSGALAESAPSSTSSDTSDEEACITNGLAGALGAQRFAELDALANSASDPTAVFSQMSDSELSSLVDVIAGCVDIEGLVAQELANEDFSPEAAACFGNALAQQDTLKSLIRAMMTGEDPTTNPEFIQIMIQIMTQDCSAPLETMLVDEFVSSGLSQQSATCVAHAFMSGGLLEALLDSLLTGTDPTNDTALANQMMQVFSQCLTPEEMQNLGG